MSKILWTSAISLVSLTNGAWVVPKSWAHGFFTIPVPEPASPVLLAVDLLSVGVLVFFFLRRRGTSNTNR